MTITTEYPIWLIFFCLAFGAGISFILYWKNSDFPRWLSILLAIARFILISSISFFLLNPLLKSIFKEIEKPVIIFAQDNSESIISGKDSDFFKVEYRGQIEELMENLSSKYNIRNFSFGEDVSENFSWDFSGKQTDISLMLDEIYTRYSNQNVGAVILATDGIYNKGANPVFSSSGIKFPIYTLALGDTAVKRDLILKKVLYNRIAYLGNQFPMEIQIEANELTGKTSLVRIFKGKEILLSKPVEINSNAFHLTIPVQLSADQRGIQRYSVKLTSLEGESNSANNSFEVFIEVLDGRQKILLLLNSPHPDIRAMRETIENSENYSADVFLASEFKVQELKKYNLIILHQLPSSKNPVTGILQAIASEGIPAMYIFGAETDLIAFNNRQAGVSISGTRNKFNESQPILNKNFVLFTLSPETQEYVKKFPPLQAPFGNYKLSPSANVLFYQKLGMVETQQPLLLFNAIADRKTSVITGEGLWRWRLNDFAQHGNHNVFNEVIQKTVQYLALKENKSKFRVNGKNNFLENENVTFDAELYNESFEPVNDPEVNFEIINEEDKKFPFVFSKTGKAYRLDAGVFPTGNYKYAAKTKMADQLLESRGEFSVNPIQVEMVNTVADHQLLFNLSEKHDGRILYPADIARIPGLLEERKDINTLSFTQKKLSDFINLKWIFFLLLALLSLEWFIRKRNGSY